MSRYGLYVSFLVGCCSWMPGSLKAIPCTHSLSTSMNPLKQRPMCHSVVPSTSVTSQTAWHRKPLRQASVPQTCRPLPIPLSGTDFSLLLFSHAAFFSCVFLLPTFNKYSLSTYCVLVIGNRPWGPNEEPQKPVPALSALTGCFTSAFNT